MRSGFFNSEIMGYDAEGMPVFDRAEEASFFAKYFSQFISNGVFPNPSTNMQVLATEGMNIKVDIGVCYINGYMGWVEPAEVLEIEESDLQARIDRIVARLNFEDKSINLFVKKGTPQGNPVAPELQRDYDIYEIGLADIRVKANAIEITQENITDLRLNTELCGIVANQLQHVDTTTIFNQYQDWLKRVTGEAETNLENMQEEFENNFNTWFQTVQDVLDGDTAGHLLNLINTKASEEEFNEFVDGMSKKYVGSNITAPTCEGFGRIHKLYGKTEEIGEGEKGPDNPYEIKCVADDINYFDKSKLSIIHAWHCAYTISSDKEIEVQNTSTDGVSFIETNTLSLKAGIYTFLANISGQLHSIRIYKGDTFLSTLNTTTGSFTLEEDSEIHFNFYIWPTSLQNTMTIRDIQIKRQKGAGYSEYGEGSIAITSTGGNDIDNKLISSKPLCSLKNETGSIVAQDYIDFTRAKIHRECGYLRLDGNLNWELDKEVNGLLRITLFTPDLNCISQNVNDMCSHFKYIADWDSSEEPHLYYYNTMIIVFVPKTIATTIDEFKTWLNENNAVFVYKLEKPFEEDIDIANNVIQYEGETVIFNSDDATMEIELTKNKTVSSINENLSALQGMYSSNKNDIKGKDGTIYGVRRQIDNPLTQWERIEGAVGLVANATKDGSKVQNDFDNIYPWSDIISCDVAQDGTINSYYGDPEFSFANPKGYIMTKFPEFYWKREQKDGYEYIYISATEHERFAKSEEFMLGRYTVSGSSTAIFCKSGLSSLTKISMTDLRVRSNNIDTNWGLMDIWRWSNLQILYLVEYADYDSQNILGYGNCNSSEAIKTGGCDNLGMKSGCIGNNKTYAVIYRGVENIFGNISQWLDGINIKDNYAYICKDRHLYMSEKVTNPYTQLEYKNAVGSGYISKLSYDSNYSAVQMPTNTSGSDNTYIPDYANTGSNTRGLCVGGYYGLGTSCGLWYADWNQSALTTSLTIGGRLLFMSENSEGGN